MRHYLFVGDARDVLGVWEVDDEVSATRLSLQLALMYPGCKTFADRSTDFETFKKGYAEFDFDGLEPDRSDDPLGGDQARTAAYDGFEADDTFDEVDALPPLRRTGTTT